MKIITRFDAISSLVDGGIAGNDEGDKGVINYLDGQTPPTEAEIDAEVKRLQAEYDSQEYARNRKAEYDALNQLEMQFDDKEDGTTTWEDAIVAIKAKWPKDNSGPV